MKRRGLLNSDDDEYANNNTVNIIVVLGKHEDGITTVRKYDENTKKHYNKGYWWSVWQKIEKELKGKYNFKYHYTDPNTNTNYNGICRDIHAGKYDLCLGLFRRTKEREQIVNYIAPIIIDGNAILYKTRHNALFDAGSVLKNVWKQFVLLLILGIFFGLFLRFFDKSRSKYMTKRAGSNYLIRAIMTGISTVFGEMGYLTERSTPTVKSTVITTIMVIIAFTIILYSQGVVTKTLVKQEIGDVNKNNIRTKPVLGEVGYAVLNALEGQGATIEPKKKNFDELIKIYLEKPSKYLGIGMSYAESIPFSKIYGLKSALGFGFYTSSGVISERRNELREDINYHIAKMKGRGEMQKICHSYYGEDDNVPICKLR